MKKDLENPKPTTDIYRLLLRDAVNIKQNPNKREKINNNFSMVWRKVYRVAIKPSLIFLLKPLVWIYAEITWFFKKMKK